MGGTSPLENFLPSVQKSVERFLVTRTRLESRFSQNDSSRVTVNDSRLELESFSQNLLSS